MVEPRHLSFEDNVVVYSWANGRAIAVFGMEKGLGIIARSERFNNQHTTADVRVLADLDARQMGFPAPKTEGEGVPVFFATIPSDHTLSDLRADMRNVMEGKSQISKRVAAEIKPVTWRGLLGPYTSDCVVEQAPDKSWVIARICGQYHQALWTFESQASAALAFLNWQNGL